MAADHKGITYPTLAAMAAAYGLLPATLRFRLKSGWPLEKALTTPAGYHRSKGMPIIWGTPILH